MQGTIYRACMEVPDARSKYAVLRALSKTIWEDTKNGQA